MEPFRPKTLGLAVLAATALAARAVKKKTLTPLGAATGFVVGFCIVATGLRGFALFFFYQLGSMATKYKKEWKERHDATQSVSSVRGARQVLAVSVIAVSLSILHSILYGPEVLICFSGDNCSDYAPSFLTCAILAHHATCLADTLASELGMLAQQRPVLILPPFPQVPPGTNGGVTWFGTFCSAMGGLFIGIFYLLMDAMSGLKPFEEQSYLLLVMLFGLMCGVLGSALDSVLGALMQASYYDDNRKLIYHSDSEDRPKTAVLVSGVSWLTNEQVNFVSTLLTTLIGGWILGPLVFA